MANNAVWSLVVLCALSPLSTGAAQAVAAEASARPTTSLAPVTIHVTASPLKDVLQLIARQAGLTAAFGADIEASPVKVTLSLKNLPVMDAFERALAGTRLTARVVAGNVVFTRMDDVTRVAQGGITGKVIDSKTRRGLKGATITLSQTNRGTTSLDDGSFRIVDVVPGSYTVQVRMLGYMKTTKAVTVVDGQTLSIECVMEPSVNALDQVVVTGTVIPTELKAVPNAITVITSQELEQRGITHIDQLFRGEVPGLWSIEAGSSNTQPGKIFQLLSRGANSLPGISAAGVQGQTTTAMKTYVDGVELADPAYLGLIDPKSIDRIEILTGPQASTIYGSGAIMGVMQVFTKRGTTTRPHIVANLQTGLLQNNFSAALAPLHDYSAQLSQTTGAVSYNVGGGWNHVGSWSPASRQSTISGYGGARVQQGPFSIDVSLRRTQGVNWNNTGSASDVRIYMGSTGLWVPGGFNSGRPTPVTQTSAGQSLGGTLTYAPTSWWSHTATLGSDELRSQVLQQVPGYSSGSDTTLFFQQSTSNKVNLGYTTTLQVPLGSVTRVTITAGGDGWHSQMMSMSGSAPVLTSLSGVGVSRTPGHASGFFAQTQVGMWDAVFLTYGVRADYNPLYGAKVNPNVVPRYGISITRDLETPVGMVTTKLRASYGHSTRAPTATQSRAQRYCDAYSLTCATYQDVYGPGLYATLPNPYILPEQQLGGEGGLELYLGNRASLVVTRYNQTVSDLIQYVLSYGDSVRSLRPLAEFNPLNLPPTPDGYSYYVPSRYINVGSIRNQGWEVNGTMNLGRLSARGTYSSTKSRILKFSNAVAVLNGYVVGGSFVGFPEHTYSFGVQYARAGTSLGVNFQGQGPSVGAANGNTPAVKARMCSNSRLRNNCPVYTFPSIILFNTAYLGGGDFNLTQHLSPRLDGIVQIFNLRDIYVQDYSPYYATMGRQTKFGLRVQM